MSFIVSNVMGGGARSLGGAPDCSGAVCVCVCLPSARRVELIMSYLLIILPGHTVIKCALYL